MPDFGHLKLYELRSHLSQLRSISQLVPKMGTSSQFDTKEGRNQLSHHPKRHHCKVSSYLEVAA